MDFIKEPLVSIIVITYNTSKFVLETLESAKTQTYQNIELIVSDDCSTDNTLEICRAWIEQNKVRFIRTELITVENNTGIAPNCNRGVKVAKGEWIKFIAGDDLLKVDCINKNIDFVNHNNKAKIVVSKVAYFDDIAFQNIRESYNLKFLQLNLSKQFDMFIKGTLLNTPAFFISRELLFSINGFDEEYLFLEDYPLVYKTLKSGNKVYGLNELTCYYRQHVNSISNISPNKNINEKYFESFKKVFNKIRGPELIKRNYYKIYFFNKIEIKLNSYILKRGNWANLTKVEISVLKILNIKKHYSKLFSFKRIWK